MKTLAAFLLLTSVAMAQYPAQYIVPGNVPGSLMPPEQQPLRVQATAIDVQGGGAGSMRAVPVMPTQMDDEFVLADRLYARFLQRQAAIAALQAQVVAAEVSQQQLRAYVCQRFCTPTPAMQSQYAPMPLEYPLPGPVGYSAPSTIPRTNAVDLRLGANGAGLRFPW